MLHIKTMNQYIKNNVSNKISKHDIRTTVKQDVKTTLEHDIKTLYKSNLLKQHI